MELDNDPFLFVM